MSSAVLNKRKSDLEKLASEEFDVLVIGAGITGAGVAWDAALRGLKVAIIDKEDFSAGTSSGSSKLVHAGLRYLAYLEFGLVHRASLERQWLFKKCPHQTEPIPFIIPVYKNGKYSSFKLRFAGVMYDLLAHFNNTENHKFLSKKETLALIPNIKNNDVLKRSLYYWDGIMDDARVTLEVILSAKEVGALCLNHVEAVSFIKKNNLSDDPVVTGIQAKDTLTGKTFEVKSKVVVNATGPWTDEVLSKINDHKEMLVPSKGIHIITKRLINQDVVLVITADDDRMMFVIPFRKDYSLIGTTDTFYEGDMDHVEVTDEDVKYVISAINNDLPNIVTKEDVISAYSGIRPLLKSPKAKSESDTSRGYEIFETHPNLFTITGGKYTIFRYMAKEMVDQIIKHLGLSKRKYRCKTKNSYLHGGKGIKKIDNYVEKNARVIMLELELEEDIVRHLVHTYGNAHEHLITLIKENNRLGERIGEGRPHVLAEIHHAITSEMCLTLSDFMLRRTQLQLIDHQGLDVVEKIAKEMAKLLDWNEKEIEQQIKNYKKDLVWNE